MNNQLIYEIILLFVLFIYLIYFWNKGLNSSKPTFGECIKKIILCITGQKVNSTAHTVILTVLLLLSAFLIIHLFFCYQWGFPASISQENSDLILQSSDWLDFLGSYLSFSGSLIMAFVVYRQSKIIDQFTIAEYKPLIRIGIHSCIKTSDCSGFKPTELSNSPPGSSCQYYTLFCERETQETKLDSFGILVFAEIVNCSKSTINGLSFSKIEFTSVREPESHLHYSNKIVRQGAQWDPSSGITQLSPGKKLRRCFFLSQIPEIIPLSKMKIEFTCNDSQPLECTLLVSKNPGKELSFLDVSEPAL